MKFIVDKKIFEQFPGVKIGALVVSGMDNTGKDNKLTEILKDQEGRQKQALTDIELGSLPEISSWRKIYKQFGSDPKDFRSSVESLLRRVRGGQKPLPQINKLVDLGNYISIKYHLPVGAEDLDKVQGDIVLGFAEGTEKGIYLGSDEEEAAYNGEVIYKDDKGFICRRWNWREADRTKIENNTTNAIFVIEKAGEVKDESLDMALEDASKLITELTSGNCQKYILDKNKYEIDIVFRKSTKTKEVVPVKKKTEKSKVITNKISSGNPQLFGQINWEDSNELLVYLKNIIKYAISKTDFLDKNLSIKDIKIEHPTLENYGDYSTNIALVLSSRMKQQPKIIASKICESVNKLIKEHQTISIEADSKLLYHNEIMVSDILDNCAIAGPGFINLILSRLELINQLTRALSLNYLDTTSKTPIPADRPLIGKKIMVEFAHPNTHKEFHIGHLRNISIGEALSRILSENGAEIYRANYEGDVGLHVAKAIWGVKSKIVKENLKMEDLEKLSPSQKAKFLGEGYVLGSKVYEEDNTLKKEIMDLNKQIYKDPKKTELWQVTRSWSLEYFDTVYKRLYSHFDRLFFESEVSARGRELVVAAVKTGIFIRGEDNSIYFPGEKYGLNNCVFITQEDYPTYEGKEVALEELEYNTFAFDSDIHVVANEQRNFFQIAFRAVELLFPVQIGKQFHLAYGMVNLKNAKISSRTGILITAEWLIDEAKKKVKEIVKTARKQKDEKLDEKDIETTSEKIAVAAVKYSMLKVNPKMDIAFDLDESVSFTGDSGPYIQYTFARCQSVLRKAKNSNSTDENTKNIDKNYNFNEMELSLLRTIGRLDEVILESAKSLSPNILCNYLFDLSQKFNLFYNQHQILNPQIPMRVLLTSATANNIKRGLHLLGIETVERM